MLFGPSEAYSNAFKNLNNSWNFFLHDVGEPVPKSVAIMVDAWTPYRVRWKELEARTFSSVSPEWTEVLAGLGARIAELNSAIRAWKASEKHTVAALVDASKLDIEQASSVLSSATATVETADDLKKKVKELGDEIAPLVTPQIPWWGWAGAAVVLAGTAYVYFKPRTTVVEVRR
jgi:hypothetical protein